MTFQANFSCSCCEFDYPSSNQYDVLEKLLTHIKVCHPKQYEKLTNNGRKMAMGQK